MPSDDEIENLENMAFFERLEALTAVLKVYSGKMSRVLSNGAGCLIMRSSWLSFVRFRTNRTPSLSTVL